MRKYAALLGLFVVAWGLMPQAVYAAIASTPTDVPLPYAPLLITAYETNNLGTDFAYLELTNTASEPQSLDGWKLTDLANKRDMIVTPWGEPGYIEPGKHVVISIADLTEATATPLVMSASYRHDGWKPQATNGTTTTVPMTVVRLEHAVYRPADLTLAVPKANVYVYGKEMMRTYNTASYSAINFEAKYRSLHDDRLYTVPPAPMLRVIEVYPYARDCSPFDSDIACGDYVKLQNIGGAPIDLDEYVLRTDSSSANRTTSNTVSLTTAHQIGQPNVLEPKAYLTVSMTDENEKFALTNSGGYVWIEDAWGIAPRSYAGTVARYVSAGVNEQGLAYVVDPDGVRGQWSTTLSPDGPSIITAPVKESIVCPDGKYLNPETNRCRSIVDAVSALAVCDEGKERNPVTGRCRSVTTTKSTLTPCGEGQERNSVTNRCRSIASAVAELLPCDEGYERNPTTNRCRKIKTVDMPLAGYPVKAVAATAQTAAMWWALGGVGLLALVYAGWEWRSEVVRFIHRATTRISK